MQPTEGLDEPFLHRIACIFRVSEESIRHAVCGIAIPTEQLIQRACVSPAVPGDQQVIPIRGAGRDMSHGVAYTPQLQTATGDILFADILPRSSRQREQETKMISLYRWKAGQTHGHWVDLPDLPPDGRLPEGEVWWLDLDDPSPEEEDLVFRRFLAVHPLTLEDMTRPRREETAAPHLPKVEEFPDYLFVVVNAICTPAKSDDAADMPALELHQLSGVVTRQFLITHHVTPIPAVTATKQFLFRHAEQGGRGPDYLFHLVLDELVDDFAPEVDRIIESLDELELKAFGQPTSALLESLVRTKRRVSTLRKTLILQREVLARLMRGEFDLVDVREIAYYRNVFDHMVRYTELIEAAREMVSDLMQTHLAAVSNQLNSIMKVLAMISTIILPMTLVAGVYGMNFENMPELKWAAGYPMALGIMLLMAVGCLIFFRWKRWL